MKNFDITANVTKGENQIQIHIQMTLVLYEGHQLHMPQARG